MWGNTAVMHQRYNDLTIYLTRDGSYLSLKVHNPTLFPFPTGMDNSFSWVPTGPWVESQHPLSILH